MTKIYESPDKGETVYEREFGEYDNRKFDATLKSHHEYQCCSGYSDKGETVYEREFGEYDNRKLVKSDITPPPFHFFAANVYKWLTTNDERDLPALIKMMESDKDVPYSLYYVPVHHSASYGINWYKPEVEGAVHLGTYKYSPY